MLITSNFSFSCSVFKSCTADAQNLGLVWEKVNFTANFFAYSFQVNGDVQLKTPGKCDLPVVSYFTVYEYNVTNEEETLVINITNPDSLSSHTFLADTMQPVLHKIYLYTTFPQHLGQPLNGDYLFVEFVLPDLIVSIVDDKKVDNNKRRVIKTEKIRLDSYQSMDPARNLSGVAAATRSWTCQTSQDLSDDDIEKYFFSGTLQSSTVNCSELLINNGKCIF